MKMGKESSIWQEQNKQQLYDKVPMECLLARITSVGLILQQFFHIDFKNVSELLPFIIIIHMANVTLPKYFYEGQQVISSEGDLGSVWLSGVHFAMDLSKLTQNNIVAVLSAAELGLSFPASIKHCIFDLKDCEQEQIRHVFYPAIRFIDQHRKNGNVLIHCAAGISRSTSLLMAYMMHRYHGSFENCLSHVMRQRPCVLPNKGFRKQLLQFCSDLGIKEGALCFK